MDYHPVMAVANVDGTAPIKLSPALFWHASAKFFAQIKERLTFFLLERTLCQIANLTTADTNLIQKRDSVGAWACPRPRSIATRLAGGDKPTPLRENCSSELKLV